MDISSSEERKLKDTKGALLKEIFETVTSYLSLFVADDDNEFIIIDLNKKVEEVESVLRSEVIGKRLSETTLAKRVKLTELLNHLQTTGETYKLTASPSGNDSEGYYMGFRLTSGNFIITWEPGDEQKSSIDLNQQGKAFEKFADLLPE